MLGKNHALYAAASWVAAWPVLGYIPVSDPVDTSSLPLFAVTTGIAAGAGVIPDLDHPDSRASTHFGVLSKWVARGINEASGGHRHGTHSILCAVVIGLLSAITGMFFEFLYIALAAISLALLAAAIRGRKARRRRTFTEKAKRVSRRTLCALLSVGVAGLGITAFLWPEHTAKSLAIAACGFCCSVGVALIGPSFGYKAPTLVVLAMAVLPGLYIWHNFDKIAPTLWILAAGGVIVHILCDAVTKGGVPFLWPFNKNRYGLGIFVVGGSGEKIASMLGIASLIALTWLAIQNTNLLVAAIR